VKPQPGSDLLARRGGVLDKQRDGCYVISRVERLVENGHATTFALNLNRGHQASSSVTEAEPKLGDYFGPVDRTY
jgi:hypothetical protein